MSQQKDKVIEVLENAKKIIFGQDDLLESIITSLVCEGHLLPTFCHQILLGQ